VYYYPGIKQIPTVKNAYFKYFAEASREIDPIWIWIATVAVVIIVVGAIVLNYKIKSKKISKDGKKG
ncbi:MAG: hypothetical protein K6T73_07515, partial [Candidatus Bathyarchaeota archaeon]|nr:hypothetical protein [Candidatus Bathyarchaeota archaeon]